MSSKQILHHAAISVILTLSNWHPENADSPIEIMELGIVTLFRLLHPKNAYLLMEVAVFGIVKSVISIPFR